MLKRRHPPHDDTPDFLTLRWHVWAIWLAFAAITLSATRTDPDIWGHVRFGLDALHTRALPTVDPYSFTQDRPWVNHEWLSEVAMAAAYQRSAGAGLIALKALVIGSAVAVLIWRMHGASPIVGALVAGLAIVATLPLSGTVRPQIWSVLGLALLMPLLKTDREPTVTEAGATAGLFALWANLHGGWITGAVVLAAHALMRTLREPRRSARWILLSPVAVAATLVNPYGTHLWTFLATTVRASRPDVSEWQPFSLQEPPIMWVSIVAPLAFLVALARRRATRPPIETVIVLLLLVSAGLRVSRVAPLIAAPALILLAPWIAQAWGNRGRLTLPNGAAAAVLAIPVVVAITAAITPVHRALTCIPISDTWAPDRQGGAHLTAASGRLWTTFDWGEYAIWHFGPRLRVSIDGRRETVYSDDIVQWHRAFDRGETRARERFAAMRPEYVWLRSDSGTARSWLGAHGYRVDVDTPVSFVAVRADLARLPAAVAALPACFP